MKKVELNHSLFEEIPTPIIWDILTRLPTKACLNCKLVCKDWYCIIIDPHFAVARRSHGCYTTLLLRGAFYDWREKFVMLELHKSVKFDELDNLSADSIIRFKSKFSHIRRGKLSLANECNGIICLKSGSAPVLIGNLLTGKYVSVKQPRRIGYHANVCGLGCCPETRQFKLLRVLKCMYNKDCVAEVQTLGTNEWRIVGDAQQNDLMNKNPTFLNGSLHWVSFKVEFIRLFHFGSEQFSRIELPGETSRHTCCLCVFDSCLCCMSGVNIDFCNIWVMREYGVKESWVKQYVFQMTSPYSPMMPIFQKEREEQMLVTHGHRWGLAVGDINSGRCTRVSILGVPAFEIMTYNANFTESQIFNRR